MRKFLVTIVMADGSRGQHHGLYRDGCSAAVQALDHFPDAKRVAARRVF